MDWLEEVNGRMKRHLSVLFRKESPCLQGLQLLIQEQHHRTMVLWAFEFAEEAVGVLLERYPNEPRPLDALVQARNWAGGTVKMPVAQRAILGAHAFAKEITSPEDIALCHAVGQACGTVHAVGHAIGFPIYDLTAMVWRYGIDLCKEPVEKRLALYADRILYWKENAELYQGEWAEFIRR